MPYRQVGLMCPSESVHFLVGYLKELCFDVRALWTPKPELTIHTAAEFEIPFAASRPDEVLLKKEVQMIIITGWPQIHSQIAVKALGIGKHVLCDSPVTLSSSEAMKMVQAAQYYPQLLALVGYGLRHLDVFRKARELINSGYIGTPIACECSVRTSALLLPDNYNWLWEWSMGGGVLNLVGCHVIDIISYLIRRRATRAQGLVKCSGLAADGGRGYSLEACDNDILWKSGDQFSKLTSTENGDRSNSTKCGSGFRRVNADDFASFLLKFDQDFVATVTLNALSGSTKSSSCTGDDAATSSQPLFFQRILISGTKGRLEIFNHEIRGETFGAGCANGAISDCVPSSAPAELRYRGEDESEMGRSKVRTVVPSMYVDGFGGLLRLLADALPIYEQQHGSDQARKMSTTDPPMPWQAGCLGSLASFEDAQYVRAVIDAVRHSSENGDWVKVDLPQLESSTRRNFEHK